MKTRTIIEHSQFRQMLSYKPAAANKSDKQEIKNELKGAIIEFYGDKWYRLKEATRAAIDFVCFTSVERGFCYASQGYLAEMGVSERTIRRIMNELQKGGIVHVAYRRLGRFNACGKPVYFFTKHAYFDYWCSFLGFDVQSSNLVDVQDEHAENVDMTGIEQEKPFFTISLPENHSNNYLKDRSKDIELVPDYIDSNFAHQYACYFGVDIKKIDDLWKIVKCQAWKINIETEHIAEGAIHALKQTVGAMKIKPIKNMAAYFTATVKGVFERIFHEELAAILDNGDNVATNEGVPLG